MASSARGPLRYEIETSSPQLQAGDPFSIFIRITNPYDVPVTVLRVATLLPVEFRDPEASGPNLLKRIWPWATEVEAPREAIATTIPAEQEPEAPTEPIVLEPGNTALKKFTVKTLHDVMFTPALYTFHIEVQYEVDGKQHRDAGKQSFNIRAPLKALVYGSFWGALVGASLRALKEQPDNLGALLSLSSLTAAIAGILIGAVIVVAFARKKDAQPFITVEDFFGGAFVGVIAGYVGFPLLDTVLPK
jgi:hypothetical protein